MKLLRAHGVKDVERLREDELRDALARLSIVLPDLDADEPFAPSPPSSAADGMPAEPAPVVTIDDVDADDPDCLPRFREPKPFLPERLHTFARAIAVKPGEVFVSWQFHDAVVAGAARLDVFAVEYFGAAPDKAEIIATAPRLVVAVERDAPGWYLHVPHERWAMVVQVVVSGDDGDVDVVVATSNVALTTPAKRAGAGPLWLASIPPDVDRRELRDSGVLAPVVPEGVSVVVAGTVDDDGTHLAIGADGATVNAPSWGLHRAATSLPTSSAWSASRPAKGNA